MARNAAQKRNKRASLIGWHQSELDTLLGTGPGSIADLTAQIDTTEQLTGLPIPEPEPVDPLTTLLARLADARSLEEVRQAAQEATQP